MTELGLLLLSIAVVAALALIWSGILLVRRGRDRRKGVLMILAAAVLLANVFLSAWPIGHGAG